MQEIKTVILPNLLKENRCVFACGSDVKNRFSFLWKGKLYQSEDNGDLADAGNFSRYLESARLMREHLGCEPDIVAHDLHPQYFSSRVESMFPNAVRIGVQHHLAHIAAVLASSGHDGPVLGVSFDGTGYGSDGHLWGGEFLWVTKEEWKRAGHLKNLKMPGGEAAVREPWRMAFALLYDHMGESLLAEDLPFLKVRSRQELLYMRSFMDKNINAPLTSSCGRLFDAVSSLIGITHVADFEAQAAINLEKKAALSEDSQSYPFDILKEGSQYVAGYSALLENMIADLKRKISVEAMARRFHNSLARLIADMAKRISEELNVHTVVLSGGVFQNRLLEEKTREYLKKEAFHLINDSAFPVNDLGLCAGQTYCAIHETRLRE